MWLYINNLRNKAERHSKDLLLMTECAFGSVLLGGATMLIFSVADVANNTWEFVTAAVVTLAAISMTAVWVFLAHKVRHAEYYEGKPHTPDTYTVLCRAHVALNTANVCLTLSAVLFTWLAWWQDVRFALEPILVFVMLGCLVAAMIARSFGDHQLGRLAQMLNSATTEQEIIDEIPAIPDGAEAEVPSETQFQKN